MVIRQCYRIEMEGAPSTLRSAGAPSRTTALEPAELRLRGAAAAQGEQAEQGQREPRLLQPRRGASAALGDARAALAGTHRARAARRRRRLGAGGRRLRVEHRLAGTADDESIQVDDAGG